jgi:hypothetical protein
VTNIDEKEYVTPEVIDLDWSGELGCACGCNATAGGGFGAGAPTAAP